MAPDPLVYLFPQLEHIDISSIGVKAAMIAGTYLATTAIFIVSYFGSFQFTTFKSYLRTKEKVFWCLSFVRAVFGIVATSFGLWYLVVDDTLSKDVVKATTVSSHIAVYICVGFFLFESSALFTSNVLFRYFDSFLALHHVLSVVCYSIVVYYDKMHFFSLTGLILEMTTPFTCLCWMLLKAKLAHTMLWKVNQIVLVHLFHCRTTIEGYMVYMTYQQWDNVITNTPIVAMIALYGTIALTFFLLTPYWTYKKMMQLFKPVDWNHPELQSRRASENAAMNGHSTGSIPEDHTKRD